VFSERDFVPYIILFICIGGMMMKKRVILAVIAVCCMAVLTGTVHANIVANPGFEAGSGSPDDWWTWNYSQTWTSADAHGGAMAERLAGFSGTWSSTWWTSWGEVGQDVAVTAGETYTFDVWLKDEGTGVNPGELYFTARFRDGDGSWLAYPDATFAAASTWTNVDLGQYTAPAGTIDVQFVLMGNPGGSILVDDANMVLVPEPVTICLLGFGGLLLRRRRA
jgi:hypothetical protein